MNPNEPIQVVINGNAGSGKTLVAAVIAEALARHFKDQRVEVLSLEGDFTDRHEAVVKQDTNAPFRVVPDTIQVIDACQNNQTNVEAWMGMGAHLFCIAPREPSES